MWLYWCVYTVSGTVAITGAGADDSSKQLDERNKGRVSKNCTLFTDCIIEIKDTLIDNAKYIVVVMSMDNLIEYSDNYSKICGSLWQYDRVDPNNNNIS